MEVETVVESRVGKIDEVTASDWHLVGIQQLRFGNGEEKDLKVKNIIR